MSTRLVFLLFAAALALLAVVLLDPHCALLGVWRWVILGASLAASFGFIFEALTVNPQEKFLGPKLQ